MNEPDIEKNPDDEQIDKLIAKYLKQIDSGELIDQEQFIAQHSESATALRRYFENVSVIEQMAGPLVEADIESSPHEETYIPGHSDSQTSIAPTSGSRNKSIDISENFGRYKILKSLGQGAMGAVYLAHDTQLDRQIALKIPMFSGDERDQMLERFYREARSAATLRHNNICPVFDVGEIDGQHYITMAFIEGRPLRDFARSKKEQPERQVATIIRKLALGLAEAHKQGVIHRDLKPANVMVDSKGEPVVMDFGLARRSGTNEIKMTQSGALIGTPAYMSPEQVEGDQDKINAPADVYSLGVIFYELLTGQLPFQGSLMSILKQISVDDPEPPSELRLDLDLRLDRICLKMLAKKIEDRYSSMEEVAKELTTYLKSPAKKRTHNDAVLAATEQTTEILEHENNENASYEEFDPYHQWLGIKSSDQPANHYRLLGIEMFEDDLNVIDNAANQRMAYVKQCGTGPHSKTSQKLLNELSAARITLLNLDKKAAYDSQLKARQPLVESPLGSPAPPIVIDKNLDQSIVEQSKRKPQKSNVVAISIVLTLLVGFGIFKMLQPPAAETPTDNQVAVKASEEPNTHINTDITTKTNNSPETKTATANNNQPTLDQPKPNTNIASTNSKPPVRPNPTTATDNKTPGATASSPTNAVNPASTVVAKTKTVDLLKLIDTERDTVSGEWKMENGTLVAPPLNNKGHRLQIPIDVPEEYVLRVEVEGIGEQEPITIGLVGGKSQFAAYLNYSYPGEKENITSGLGMLDGLDPNVNESTYSSKLFFKNGKTTIIATVRKAGIQLTCDGEKNIDWAGNFNRLSLHHNWAVPNKRALFLGPSSSAVRYTKVELTPISGTETPQSAKPIDLLAKIDLERDVVDGKFSFENSRLTWQRGGHSRLQIPFDVPAEYDLVVTATRTSGTGIDFVMGLPVGRHQVLAVIGDPGSGLHLLDGKNYRNNESFKPGTGMFQPDKESTFICSVRQSSVKVTFEGRTLIDWKGDPARFSLEESWSVPDKRALFIGGIGVHTVSKWELRPLSADKIPQFAKPIDLLAKIDLERDTIAGNFKMENKRLNWPPETETRLQIPFYVPEEYDLIATSSRTSRGLKFSGFVIGLLVGGRQVPVVIGNPGSGLHWLDGKNYKENESSNLENDLFQPDKESTIVCTVRKSSIKVTFDGKTLIDWRGNSARVLMYKEWAVPDKRALFIGGNGGYSVSKLELRPVGSPDLKSTPIELEEKRLALPDEAARQKSLEQIQEFYRDDYKSAKSTLQKTNLGKKLLQEASESKDDVTTAFVLLQEARRLSIEGGETDMAFAAVEQLVNLYQLDSIPLKIETTIDLSKTVRFTPQKKPLAEKSFELVNAVIAIDDYKTAEELLAIALVSARSAKERDLVKQIADRREEIEDVGKAFSKAKNALVTLKENPDDQEANLIAGRFLCFLKNDWEQGLPMLTKGSDEDLKTLAEQDLSQPTDAETQTAIGEHWWEFSRKEQGTKSDRLELRAGYWYQKALPQLVGIARKKIEGRLDGLAKKHPIFFMAKNLDYKKYNIKNSFTEFNGPVLSVDFSSNSKLLATGCQDGTVKIWDVISGTKKITLAGHGGSVTSVVFSPDGKLLATGSSDKSVKLWDAATGSLKMTLLNGYQGRIFTVAFSPDGKLLASGYEGKQIVLWDMATGTRKTTLVGHTDIVLSVAFSPDGKTLASGSSDTSVILWNVATGAKKATLSDHAQRVSSVIFSPDGKTLASGSWDNSAILWDVKTWAKKTTFSGQSNRILCLAFSPDGKTLAYGCSNTANFWDVASGKEVAALSGHRALIFAIAFSPNGKMLASGSDDRTAKLWEFGTKTSAK